MATENKIEEKKHSSAKEPYKSAKTKSTQLLRTNSLGGESLIKALSEERRESSNTLNRTEQHWTKTEWKMTTQKKREEKKHSNTKEKVV